MEMTPQTQALPSGTVLDGRYELTRPIAHRPDADLYEGVDRVLERPVTVKVHRGATPEDRERFDREVHELANRDGGRGDRVFDAGADGEIAYAVLETRDDEPTTEGMAVVAAPSSPQEDLTQPIATDHTAELPVPPLLLPDPEPPYVAPAPSRWTPRATRNAAIAAACLIGVGALVLAAENGPDAVETPTAPSSTVAGADADQSTDTAPTVASPTTAAPTTTAAAVIEEPTEATLFPPGFPFEDGGPRGKDKKD
jgi:hypothetical protein